MKAQLVLLSLLVAAITCLAWFGGSETDMRMPVSQLPDHVGRFKGENAYYCQDENCLHSFSAPASEEITTCPECGYAVDSVALAEKRILPADTTLMRKKYTAANGQSFFASVVVSGGERRSIHKPQICLVGQGFTITAQRTTRVSDDGDIPLKAMLLDLTRHASRSGNNGPASLSSYFYWFTDGKHETPYHLVRLLLMARDNVIYGVRRRWAYITVASARGDNDAAALDKIRTFTEQLYPLITRK